MMKEAITTTFDLVLKLFLAGVFDAQVPLVAKDRDARKCCDFDSLRFGYNHFGLCGPVAVVFESGRICRWACSTREPANDQVSSLLISSSNAPERNAGGSERTAKGAVQVALFDRRRLLPLLCRCRGRTDRGRSTFG